MEYNIKDMAIPEMTLTNPELKLSTFTPVEFKRQGLDTDLLMQNINKSDEANAKNIEQYNAVQQAIGQQRNKIHQDADTLKRFDELTESYNKKVKDIVNQNHGSFTKLGMAVNNFATEASNDKTINGMIRDQGLIDEHKKFLQEKMQKGEIDQRRFDRLMSEEDASYKFQPVTDQNTGQVIGSRDWHPVAGVHDIIKPEQISVMMKELSGVSTSIWSKDTKSSVFVNDKMNIMKDGNLTTTGQALGSTHNKNAGSLKQLTKEKLKVVYDKYLQAHPELLTQYGEELKDMIFEYERWGKELDNPGTSNHDKEQIRAQMRTSANLIFGKGAGGAGYINGVTYFYNKVNSLVQEQAYKDTSSETETGFGLVDDGKSSSSSTTTPVGPTDYMPRSNGSSVETDSKYGSWGGQNYGAPDYTQAGDMYTKK